MTWQAIDEGAGLWSAEYRVPGFLCRSTALSLPTGGFLVFSPGGTLAAGFAEKVGRAEHLLAPNSFHHMGLADWQQAFPDAVVSAAPSAHKRLAKRGHTGVRDLKPVIAALPTHVTLLEPRGSRIGEVWLRVETASGIIWCVGDSFFNLPRLSKRLGTRLFQRTLRAAPGLSMSNLMKWGGLQDRKAFKSWLVERIDADQPSKLVVLHGDVVTTNTTEQLRQLVQRRL